MYVTEVAWWGFVAYSILITLFMLWFVRKVREKGG